MTNHHFNRREMLGASLSGVAAAAVSQVAQAQPIPASITPNAVTQRVELVAPPFVHVHQQATQEPPKIIEFRMVIEEKPLVIDAVGTTVQAMTFNGSVPGPLMVVHQGDYVELTLVNPATNMLPHNIDFHAATGAMGGGDLTLIGPGQEVVLRFQATRAGVFVYHCAPGGLMIPWHTVHGMNGAIMVLPRDGLRDAEGNALVYDRIYYVGEQDFYVPRDEAGQFINYDGPMDGYAETVAVMRTLTPTHEVFNGRAGALTGENALTAAVGETVLIVHSQANRDSRPHLIGGHGDYVWETGKFANPPERDLETWFIRGGSAGAALYEFRQPGMYNYVNHNLIEAVLLGAAAQFHVTGQWNDDLMRQVAAPRPITDVR